MKTLKLIMIGNILLTLIVAGIFTTWVLSTGVTAELTGQILNWAVYIFLAIYGISSICMVEVMKHRGNQ
jgi:hypothetical protein